MKNLSNILIKTRRTLSEKLFDVISSYDIYCEFIGEDVEVGTEILSPIRVDSRPTFRLFIPEDKDEVFFKDFAWRGGNVFTFVRLFALYQDSIVLSSRYEIIFYIDNKLGLGLFGKKRKNNYTRRKLDISFFASKRVIKFKSREFTERDIKYWKQYHITIETLKLFDVRSVHKLLDENEVVKYTVPMNTLTFAYVIYDKLKLYRPEDDIKFKWRNTCPSHYYQGLQQILMLKTNNKKLIWTKSLKDVMVFYTFLYKKYDILAPHGETYIPTSKFLDKLFKKYDEIIVIYDFDLAGVAGANRLRKRDSRISFKFVSTKRIRINGKITTIDKDISDYSVGRKETEIMNKLDSMNL